jgi:hypothetical protein
MAHVILFTVSAMQSPPRHFSFLGKSSTSGLVNPPPPANLPATAEQRARAASFGMRGAGRK